MHEWVKLIKMITLLANKNLFVLVNIRSRHVFFFSYFYLMNVLHSRIIFFFANISNIAFVPFLVKSLVLKQKVNDNKEINKECRGLLRYNSFEEMQIRMQFNLQIIVRVWKCRLFVERANLLCN